jgi:uncharacterized protein (UPF0276 family)
VSGREIPKSLFRDLGFGLGLRAPHYHSILRGEGSLDWVEALTENYLGIGESGGGRGLDTLLEIRTRLPVVLHGVSLSIGSTDPLDLNYLKKLRALSERLRPEYISDHICWTGVGGRNLHDLLPLPFTNATLDHLVPRISQVQDFLGSRIVLENVSSYLTYRQSEMPEWDFIAELSRRADCGILLDVNNVYVSSVNHGFRPEDFLAAIPWERVAHVHLAGHSDHGEYLIDTHDQPICPEVWDLYRLVNEKYWSGSTLIERDANIPSLAELEQELEIVRSIAGVSAPKKEKGVPRGTLESAQTAANALK